MDMQGVVTMRAENHPVCILTTALDAAITNATEPTRELQAVGRLVVRCQACDHWKPETGCQRLDRLTWVDLLITPGQVCSELSGNSR